MKFILILKFAALMLLASGCAVLSGPDKSPDSDSGPLELAIKFYQGPLDHLNAVRTGQCPMYPSCSEYAMQAMEKHGIFLGSMLACDRLMRCGRNELDFAPKIPVKGTWRYYDPVSANDFWWHR